MTYLARAFRLKSVDQYALWLGLCVLGFVVFKVFRHIHVGIFDIEEFYKTEYIFHVRDIFYFIPGFHGPNAFFGHPGLNNFLYYFFSEIFGASILTVRVFSLIMSCLCVVFYFLFLRQHTDGRTALLAALSFGALPMFNVQSIIFLNELGSFFFVFASLYLFSKKHFYAYAFFGMCAVLYLESAVSYYLFLVGHSGYRLAVRSTRAGALKPLLCSCAPIVALCVFFVCEKLGSGLYSNHNTVTLIHERLSSLSYWANFYYAEIIRLRWVTLKENIPVIYVISTGALIFAHLKFRKKWSHDFVFYVLFLPFLMQLVYFSFLSTYEGGRDFYSGFLFFFLLLQRICETPKVWKCDCHRRSVCFGRIHGPSGRSG